MNCCNWTGLEGGPRFGDLEPDPNCAVVKVCCGNREWGGLTEIRPPTRAEGGFLWDNPKSVGY